jgi:hypothetical protein
LLLAAFHHLPIIHADIVGFRLQRHSALVTEYQERSILADHRCKNQCRRKRASWAGKGTELFGLYAKINKASGAIVTYVQWSEVYWVQEWRFYSRASNSNGQSYSFDRVSRDVSKCGRGTCIYSETYNIGIPAADLRAGAKDGVSFKIYGKNGDERVINLSPALIEEFNAKVAEAVKLRKA